jgi:hypothetical protein
MKKIVVVLIISWLNSIVFASAPNPPTGLMTELLSYPEKTYITDKTPEFSWEVNDVDNNEIQTAYQILVDSCLTDINANKGVFWNSDKVISAKSAAVTYAGTNLLPGKTYFWKVKTWDKDGNEGVYSNVQSFTIAPDKPTLALTGAMVSNGRLVLNNSAYVQSQNAESWTNFTIELDAQIKANAVGVNFRVRDNNNYYMWQLSSKERAIKAHKRVNGTFTVIKTTPYTFNVDSVYKLKIETQGTKIKTYINNMLVDSLVDNSFAQGGIGFRQGQTELANIDNVLVKSADQILLKEDFEKWGFSNYYKVETKFVAPETFLNKGSGSYFIDFGKDAFARVVLTITGNGGEVVTVKVGECKLGNQVNATPPNANVIYYSTAINLLKGTHTYEVEMAAPNSLQSQGISNVLFNTMPFRYCELSGVPGPFTEKDINQQAVFYPFNDNAASFQSSNSILNQVWDLCHYSMKATSWLGIYVDGNRERKPYEADAYIQQLGHYSVDKDAYSIARRSHEYLITNPTWPTEWTPQSVLMAYTDWMWTGDDGSITAYYTDLKAKTQHALTTSNNLISTKTGLLTSEYKNSIHFTAGDYRDIVDWPEVERDGYVLKDYNTVVNAVHHGAMNCFKTIADSLKQTTDSEYFINLIDKNKTAFNTLLWDNTNKRYVDGIGTTHSALHASIFAVAFGLADDSQKTEVAAFLKSKGMDCSVYGAQYYLEALYNIGLDQKALDLLTSKETRSWYNMIQEGSTISMEAWGQTYKSNQDWNHAWGAALANIIPQYLMGVKPLSPGFGKFQIKPQTGNLETASLKMPTVKGEVGVTIENRNSTYKLTVRVPVNTTAQVCVPALNNSDNIVQFDNSSIVGKREGNFIVIDNVGSGEHSFVREYNKNIRIPGRIEGEAYSSNNGGIISPTTDQDGVNSVDSLASGNYLNYDVNVESTAYYKVQCRVASKNDSIKFRLKMNNIIIDSISAAETGGEQAWQTITRYIPITSGHQTMRIESIGDPWNLNWINFSLFEGAEAVKARLDSLISVANELYNTTVEGINEGNFSAGNRGLLYSAIQSASVVSQNYPPQTADLNNKIATLENAITALENAIADYKKTAITYTAYIINPDFEYKSEGVLNDGTTFRGIPYGWSSTGTLTGNSFGINNDGINYNGSNLCWINSTPMPAKFELYQVINNLPAGDYTIKCRLAAFAGQLTNVRLFANNSVQYYGNQADYAQNLSVGEPNTFAGYTGSPNTSASLKEMAVNVTINKGESLKLGISSSNLKSDGTSATDNSGWFKVDNFSMERKAEQTVTTMTTIENSLSTKVINTKNGVCVNVNKPFKTGNIAIYSITGVPVSNFCINNIQTSFKLPLSGVYIARITLDGSVTTAKVIMY